MGLRRGGVAIVYLTWWCVVCLFELHFFIHSILAYRSSHEQRGAEEMGAVCESNGSNG